MSASKKPRVSVLMAVYNEEEHIKESIESILQQTFTDFEFLIINDASTDKSRQLIAEYSDSRIRILDNETNLGLPASLNRGLREARGQYIARQDADDISVKNRLNLQVDALDNLSTISLLGTYYVPFDDTGKEYPVMAAPTDPIVMKWQMLFHNKFGHSTVMFRKDTVEELGGYNEKFRLNQDYELWSRFIDKTAVKVLPKVCVCRRIGNEQPPEITFKLDGPISPACEISVNNLQWLTNHALSEEQCIFLHGLLGAYQLPQESSNTKRTHPAPGHDLTPAPAHGSCRWFRRFYFL